MSEYYGYPEIYYACISGNTEQLKQLLLEKENLKAVRSEIAMLGKRRPLHIACAKPGVLTLVQLLVDNGAKVDDSDILKRTALHYAANAADFDTIKYMLDQQRKTEKLITKQDEQGRSAIHSACMPSSFDTQARTQEEFTQILNLLLDGLKDKDRKEILNAKDNFGITPLMYAKQQGYVVDGYPLASIADIVASDPALQNDFTTGSSRLMHAAYTGDDKLIMRELSVGADPMQINSLEGGANALHYVCRGLGTKSSVEIFMRDPRTNPLATDQEARTPLHYASFSGNSAAVDVLLQSDRVLQNINISDKSGCNALHALILGDGNVAARLEIIQVLYEANIDLSVRYKKQTAEELAVSRKSNILANKIAKLGKEQTDKEVRGGFAKCVSGCLPGFNMANMDCTNWYAKHRAKTTANEVAEPEDDGAGVVAKGRTLGLQ